MIPCPCAASARPSTLALLAAPALLAGACSQPDAAAAADARVPDAPGAIALFDGESLDGWHADVPAADDDPDAPASFVVQDGMLISRGEPRGHLITDEAYSDYRLVVEYRWLDEPGNCGVLVHASTPRRLYGMFPQSIEVQMHAGNAGDFWCIGEDVRVEDEVARRGPRERWGVDGDRLRRIRNLTDDSENPPGEWNRMEIACRGDEITVWVNGDLVNHGFDCTATRGRIALQAEGAAVAFRRIAWMPLNGGETVLGNDMAPQPSESAAVKEATFAAG